MSLLHSLVKASYEDPTTRSTFYALDAETEEVWTGPSGASNQYVLDVSVVDHM